MADTDTHLRVISSGEHRDVDPELVKLRRRLPVGPVLAFSVFGLAVFLLWSLRADFFYAQHAKTPEELGSAAELLSKGYVQDNTYVAVRGGLDYAAAGDLHGHQGRGYRLVPVLGTQRRLWLRIEGEAANVTPVYDDRWTGRVRRLAKTPIAEELDRWLASGPGVLRFVYPDALERDGLPAKDVHGESLSVTPDTPVIIEERSASEAQVTLVATDTVKDAAGAAAALASAGLAEASAKPTEQTDTSWTFRVPGADLAAITAKLRAVKIFGADASPVMVKHQGAAKDLHIAGDQVTLGAATVPKGSIRHLALRPPSPRVSGDAYVLFDGETPARYWYMAPLYGVLAVIALFMLWAGTRALLAARVPPRPTLVDDDEDATPAPAAADDKNDQDPKDEA